MKLSTMVIGSLALALLTGATAASATIVDVTLTGNSENITDNTGVFGLGTTITGQPFVETFVINTLGGNVVSNSTFVSYNDVFGTAGPYAVSGSLTINGRTFSTVGSDYSNVNSGSDYQINSDDNVPNKKNSTNDFYLDLTGAGLPKSVTQPISLAINGTTTSSANDSFLDETSGGVKIDAGGTLNPTQLTISLASAAPEPSGWALMIAGVGVIGVAFRQANRRRGFTLNGAEAAI